MHVLIYTSKSSYTVLKVGGAETSLRLLAESLATLGHTVTYATNSASRVRGSAREEVAGVEVVYLSSFRNALGRRLPLWLSRRLDRLFGKLKGIERAAVLSGVDIVLLFYQPHPARYFLARRKRYGYRVVLRMAGLDWYEEARKTASRRRRYERLFDSVDSINYTSAGLRRLCEDAASRLGIQLNPADSFVHDIGVHRRTAHVRWVGSRPGSPLRAVSATRFSGYQKRHDLLVKAVGLLHERGVLTPLNFSLRLIGDGSERLRVEHDIENLGIGHLCHVQGFLPQEELWQTLASSDLLCHPCDYEGLSKIVAESMMLGLPVLASRVVPLTDEISDGNTGFLAPNTPEDWADRLQFLCEHPEVRVSVSTPAREYANRRYDPVKNAQRYITQFDRILRREAEKGAVS